MSFLQTPRHDATGSRRSSPRTISGNLKAFLYLTSVLDAVMGRSPDRPTVMGRSPDRPTRLKAFLYLISVLVIGTTSVFTANAVQPRTDAELRSEFEGEIQPLIQRFCAECHSGADAEADINLPKTTSPAAARANRELWMQVDEVVRFGAMPPEDEPQPMRQEREQISRWIQSLFAVDCTKEIDPGRETIRRLNRSEYNNTVRDLIGLDLDPAKDFPSDDVGEGFDNIGDVLSLPPLLFEKYVQAAESIADAAVVTAPSDSQLQHREGKQLKGEGSAQLGGSGVFSLASKGTVSSEFNFPRGGEYLIRVEAGAQQAGPEKARMEVKLDGRLLEAVEVRAPSDRLEAYELRTRVADAGKYRVAATFVNDYYNPSASDPRQRDRNLVIGAIEVAGPVDWQPEKLPASHRHILFATPEQEGSPQAAAGKIMERFASRAFRRPVTDDELQRLVALVQSALDEGDSFERGIQVAVTTVLVSPHFLFRVELDPSPDDPSHVRRLSDYELATRLSYFLWSTMPDERLTQLAAEGTLQQDGVLREQVHRMLQDPKADALVDNFAGQWLNLRNLDDITPDPKQFATFDDSLRDAMRQETQLLFATVMREDRSIMEFLTADFTFVNQQLAEHYGIDGVQGEDFQRVSLTGGHRVGMLTQASILTLTSNPTRTSGVKRGKWILENVLGTPPPEPPVGTPPLEETQAMSPAATQREQLTMHRENPVCASCHVQMDDLGFGFENFDAIGRWRETERGKPIDTRGELPSGEKFSGPVELVGILGERRKQFGETLTRKMLVYALGRGLQPFDRCAEENIVRRLEEQDYRFSELVLGIVQSEPFLKRRGERE